MVSRCIVCVGVTGIVGASILITGCVLIGVFHHLIHSEVKDQIPLKTGSESYKNWVSPPAPIYFQVWFYDVVNYMEVQKGEKPAFNQKGPYTYREKRHKEDIVFNDDGTVQYREIRTMFFDREKSVGSEEDRFHCINIPMMTVAFMVYHKIPALERLIDIALEVTGEKIFTNVSVKDIMWGYNDPFLTEVAHLAKLFHVNVSIPADFGLFYGTNGSDDGVYKIHSGQKDVDRFGEIVTWNNERELNIWTSDSANSINGSDGTIYPPFIDTSTTKYLFSSDICRSLGMDHVGSVKERGIPMERFVAPEILFANHTVNPANAGFCTPAGNCLPSGLLNASACRQGAPIVMSMPNFLGCDQDIIDSMFGIHPNPEEHQSYLDIEPNTGVVMNAGKKLQLNVVFENIKGFSETKNIKKRIYFPVMWLNESALIDEKDAAKFKSEVLDKIKLTDGIKYGLIALGSFIIVMVLGFFGKRQCTKKQDGEMERLIPDRVTGNTTDYVTVNCTDNTTDNVTDNATDNVTDNATDNGTDNATDNVTDNATDNATDNVTDNATDNVTDIATDNASQHEMAQAATT